jgi:hypothetical protein
VSIIGYGVSDTLKSIFEGLRQTTVSAWDNNDAAHSYNKYTAKDVDKLSQHIVCRHYGKLCLELSYLCWAIIHSYPSTSRHRPLLDFFWLANAHTPKRFRAAFAQPWQSKIGKVTMAADYLQLELGTVEFAISPSRIGLLAVFMEFLHSIEPGLIANLQANLTNANDAAVKALSSHLQKSIYQFLKDHLPEAQLQKRFRYFEQWLQSSDRDIDTLADDDVIVFWDTARTDPEAESYVLYNTSLSDILDGIDAYKIADSQFNVAYAASFGADLEAGEIDPGKIETLLFESSSEDVSIKQLCENPKCLTQEQVLLLHPLVRFAPHQPHFLSSLMRMQIFGSWQAVLVQAKRKSPLILADKLSRPPTSGYLAYVNTLADIQRATEHSLLCLLHVLLNIDSAAGLNCLLSQLPPPDVEQISHWLAETYEGNDPLPHYKTLTQQIKLQFPAARLLIDKAEQAFKQNNKAGFKTMPTQADADIYQAAVETLSMVAKVLQRHTAAILCIAPDMMTLETIFCSDACIFIDRFKQIYGEANARG